MLGEKYVDRDYAKTGESFGDDASPFVSGDRGTVRWAAYSQTTYLSPMRDTRGNPSNRNDAAFGLSGLGTYNFGSAHPYTFNMAMCDGSVRSVGYDVSEKVHRCLCNREDRKAFEMP
jgi:prepilin-type processing-associated H-X9-DG protein